MPGRDGTGPKGKGPMTGIRSGSCMLRIPDNQDEPIQGFAGAAGWPVSFDGKPERKKEVSQLPLGERTIPTGAGPGTGRMKGLCMRSGVPGTTNRPQDSAAAGKGRAGRGQRHRFSNTALTGWRPPAGFCLGRGSRGLSTSNPDLVSGSQLESLKALVRRLAEALAGLKERMRKMESNTTGNHQA